MLSRTLAGSDSTTRARPLRHDHRCTTTDSTAPDLITADRSTQESS